MAPGIFTVASSNAAIFSNSTANDVLLHTSTSNQGLLLGVNNNNQKAAIQINTSAVHVSSHVVPTQDITYDLGASNFRFRDLWLSGNTIHLDDVSISKTSDGAVQMTAPDATPARIIVKEVQVTSDISSSNVLVIRQDPTTGNASFVKSTLTTDSNNPQGPPTAVPVQTSETIINNLFSMSNNIGIGTANPSGTLHVAGSIFFTGGLLQNGVPFTSGTTLSNLTINRVTVANSSNNIFTASNLFWDNTNQRLGIGIDAPQFPLHVNGFATSNANNVSIFASHDIAAFSDARVKTDLLPITEALSKVEKLTGYTFERVPTTGKRMAGVIAQDVLEVLPEVVNTDDDGYYSVSYGNMVGLIINAIKELSAEVKSIKAQIGV